MIVLKNLTKKSEQKTSSDSLKSPKNKIIQRDGLKFKLHALEAKQVIKSEWASKREGNNFNLPAISVAVPLRR